jgi:hypothetical protein
MVKKLSSKCLNFKKINLYYKNLSLGFNFRKLFFSFVNRDNDWHFIFLNVFHQICSFFDENGNCFARWNLLNFWIYQTIHTVFPRILLSWNMGAQEWNNKCSGLFYIVEHLFEFHSRGLISREDGRIFTIFF